MFSCGGFVKDERFKTFLWKQKISFLNTKLNTSKAKPVYLNKIMLKIKMADQNVGTTESEVLNLRA